VYKRRNMIFLHLDKDFKPAGKSIDFEAFTFNGGEPHIKIQTNLPLDQEVTITTRVQSFNDLGLLLVANDALQRMGAKTIHLLLPYFPGARQDRIMIPGEPLTVKVYAEIINQADFATVTVFDPHSEVTAALVKNIKAIPNYTLVKKSINNYKDFLLVSPDGGALKKIYKVSKELGGVPVIECSKKRSVATGALSGFAVYAKDLENKTCVIVDDICDGGGTFLGLAKELKNKNAGNLILVVTHGIFSKGLEELSKCFSAIYCSDSFSSINHPKLNQIKISEILSE